MVVIVPTLTERDSGDQSVVARIIARFEAPRTPQMGCGIHQPRCVPADGHSEESAPEDHCPAADREKEDRGDGYRNVIILVEPLMISVIYQIGAKSLHIGWRLILRLAAEDPTHVRPV